MMKMLTTTTNVRKHALWFQILLVPLTPGSVCGSDAEHPLESTNDIEFNTTVVKSLAEVVEVDKL